MLQKFAKNAIISASIALCLGTSTAYAVDSFVVSPYNTGSVTGVSIFGTHSNGSFTDTVNFSLDAGKIAEAINPVNLSFTGYFNTTNMTGLNLALYRTGGAQDILLGRGASFTVGAPQLAGNYKAIITGIAAAGPSSVYNAVVTVSPVPEPETYAMMLGGLAVIGAAAFRRKKQFGMLAA